MLLLWLEVSLLLEFVILDATHAHNLTLCLVFNVSLASIYLLVPLMDLESASVVVLAASIALQPIQTLVLPVSLEPILQPIIPAKAAQLTASPALISAHLYVLLAKQDFT